MNRYFGRFVSGVIEFAPDIIVDGDYSWYNPNKATYLNAGYLPVIWEKPDGTSFNGKFQEQDGVIVALYDEAVEEQTLDEKVEELEEIVQELILAQWEAEEDV